MKSMPGFALNRIIQPNLTLLDFLQLAVECSASGVEIRNDLADPSLLGSDNPEKIRNICRDNGIDILTVNALQRFNDPDLFGDKISELRSMMEVASSVGCSRIVLCPVNDPDDLRNPVQQHVDLVSALNQYGPIFEESGMVGLVEPLGFNICSLRYKKQAVNAIAESEYTGLYQIVHDTFHHFLSGELDYFPEETGLIHASGVTAAKSISDITDDDRYLVDEMDIMDNKGQIAELYRNGFKGIISFEPFSPGIQVLSTEDVKTRIQQSMQFIFT